MNEFSELDRLVRATDRAGSHPGMVEVSRDEHGGILARVWSDVLDGGTRDRTMGIGDAVLVTMQVPTGITEPSTRWAAPSVLAAELIGPPPEPYQSVPYTGPRRRRENDDTDPDARAAATTLAAEATIALKNSEKITDRDCPHCHATGEVQQGCLCTVLGTGAGVVNLDHATQREYTVDPDCPACDGTGTTTRQCFDCQGRGVVCAPYDLTITGLPGSPGTALVPGQPSALASLTPITAEVSGHLVYWTLSQGPVFRRVDLGDHELFTTAGHPMPQVLLASAIVRHHLDEDERWPTPEEIASGLADGLARDLARHGGPEAARWGYQLDDTGMIRSMELVARPPLDGAEVLAELTGRAEEAGLSVLLSEAFIATGESGPQVLLADSSGEPVAGFEPEYRLIDAIQVALVDFDGAAPRS